MKPALILHGGAWTWDDGQDAPKAQALQEAARAGWHLLQQGASAIDAVEKAVNVLEDAPLFDAGTGSHLNAEGYVEMDAIIIDGTTHNFGAVAGVQRVRYPVSLARAVMERTPHNLFVGAGADALAKQLGIEIIPNVMLVTPQELENFLKQDTSGASDTVGAIALDMRGNVAAATSTGGTPLKMAGRVGDSPIFGAGGYADTRFGGASATGRGEHIMRVLLSKYAVDRIEAGASAQEAAEQAMAYMGGFFARTMAGIIVLDQQGRVGFAHSSPKIAVAWVDEGGQVQTRMTRT